MVPIPGYNELTHHSMVILPKQPFRHVVHSASAQRWADNAGAMLLH